MTKLETMKRETKTKVKQLRRKGIVPGCIYGKEFDPSLMIQFSEKDAIAFLKSHSTGSPATVKVGDEEYDTILKEVSKIPMSPHIEHLSFQKLTKGVKITGKVDLILKNEDLAKGQVKHILYSVDYRSLPKDIVDRIEIDVEGKNVGTSYTFEDIPELNNENIELLMPLDSLIAEIVEVSQMHVEEKEIEEVEEEITF